MTGATCEMIYEVMLVVSASAGLSDERADSVVSQNPVRSVATGLSVVDRGRTWDAKDLRASSGRCCERMANEMEVRVETGVEDDDGGGGRCSCLYTARAARPASALTAFSDNSG